MKTFALAGLILFGALNAQADAQIINDCLFAKMVGNWSGHGTRRFPQVPAPGQVVQVQVEVHSTLQQVDGELALVSENQLTETSSDGQSKTYATNYWVKEVAGQPGHYVLGRPASTQVTSTGILDENGSFLVEQILRSGSQSLVVHSKSEFSPQTVEYSETFLVGSEVESQTSIQYQRIELDAQP